MYKLLLVDDEPLILHGLAGIISWEEYGIEIVASVSNGTEALDVIQKTKVDIIITDIKMDGLDGLELIKKIKGSDLNIKIIILSGYDDFKYVKEAAKYGIENYLLKPIEEDELSSTLQQIIEKLDNERKEEYNRRKENSILKENILFRWMTGNISENELLNRAEFLGIDLDWEFYLVCLIRVFNMGNFSDDNGSDYLPIGVQNICKELLENYCDHIVFNSVLGDTVILFYGQKKCFDIRKVTSILEEIIKNVKHSLNVNLLVTIGSMESDYNSVSCSYKNAYKLFDYSIVFPAGTIISYDKIRKDCKKANGTLKINYKILINAILTNDAESAKQFINEIYAEVSKSVGITPEFMKNLVIEILYNVFGPLNINHMLENNDDQYNSNFFEKLSQFTLPDIFNWLNNIIETYIQKAKASHDSLSPVIKSVLKYINENYMNEISLKTLSASFHINAAYLGQLFKRETGELFSNYLNNLRIEKAKAMLISTDLKEYDIIKKIGYTNINYFSNLFKKKTGVYPTEFKKYKANCSTASWSTR